MRSTTGNATGFNLAATLLVAALVAACNAPPPPPPGQFQPLKMNMPANTPANSPIAPPPKDIFAPPVDAGIQAPRTPLREDHPNAPESVNACVDAWLNRHGLNEYGDAPGTMYPGATPLFNERTGKRVDRMDYLFAKNSELRADCAPDRKR